MAFEELTGVLELDANGYESGVDSAVGSSEELVDATAGVEDQLFALDSAGVAAGAGLAAVGSAMTAATERSKEWRESLGRTSTSMGMTREETQNLARDISNATFPMDDATATMDALAQQGVTTQDEMEDVAAAADMVADATGATAQSVAENAGPALAAMGEDVSELEEHMDTFTFVARNTTMSVDDFSRMVRRIGPEIQEMGMGVEDTAAIMSALEEQGMDSRTAMREFRQAANDADGDQQALIDTLGLSEEAIAEQEGALAEAEGTTEEHAAAANESVSTMDRLSQAFDEATLAAGGVLEPVEAAGPALMAMGGAMTTVSAINWAAVPSFAAVSAAAAPFLPILLGVAAGAAALYGAWETNFLGVQNITEDVLDALGAGFDWLKGVIDDGVTFAIEMIMTLPDALGRAIDAIPGVDSEDVIGQVDTDSITDSLFPPEPGEEGEDAGEAMGEGASEGAQEASIQGHDISPPEEQVEAEGEAHGEAYAQSFDSAAQGGAGGGGVSDATIRSDGLTPEMRRTLRHGVEGFQQTDLEDAPTEITEELWDAMIEQQGGVSPDSLGVSNAEFQILQQRFGDGSGAGTTGGGSASSGATASGGGGSPGMDRVVLAIEELKDMLQTLTIEGELDVDETEWDRLVTPRARLVYQNEIDRAGRGVGD
jgi:hypothetical protein